MLTIGQKAPNFKLSDKNGQIFQLKNFKEQFLVIYFYPKDDTPGCTIEAKEFSDLLPNFKKQDAAIIGISGGSDQSKQKFCDKHDLNLLLLTDGTGEVGTSYGAYGEKTFMGKKSIGFLRMTFIVDRAREIVKIYNSVKAQGHAQEVLEAILACKK